MIRTLISLLFLMVPFHLAAQTWEILKIDSAVSVKLPKGFTESEKGEKYSLVAVSPFGTILIFKTPDQPLVTPDIEKEKHLQKYYNNYLKEIRNSSVGGIIKDEKTSTLGKMSVKDFTLQTDTGSGVLYRDFRILHANGATYTFEFLYQDLHKEHALPERDFFFNSIEINDDLNLQDQFTEESLNMGKPDNTKYMVIGSGAVLLLIAVAIVVIRRKRKK